jgi:hypothetical protein
VTKTRTSPKVSFTNQVTKPCPQVTDRREKPISVVASSLPLVSLVPSGMNATDPTLSCSNEHTVAKKLRRCRTKGSLTQGGSRIPQSHPRARETTSVRCFSRRPSPACASTMHGPRTGYSVTERKGAREKVRERESERARERESERAREREREREKSREEKR